jgi:propionyl-CoA synthetase
MPGWDVHVLDAAGQDAPAGVDGAIVVKLPMPPGSLSTLWADDDRFVASYLSTFDGYYLTGDSGHLDGGSAKPAAGPGPCRVRQPAMAADQSQ